MSFFFDHLVVREEIEIELDNYSLGKEEREEILEIIDQHLTQNVLNLILNHLPKDRHTEFIQNFHSAPHNPQLIEYLKTHAHPEIEDEIVKHANQIKKDILAEIKKSSVKRSPRKK